MYYELDKFYCLNLFLMSCSIPWLLLVSDLFRSLVIQDINTVMLCLTFLALEIT